MKAVTRKRYTAEFKAQAVNLVELGKPVPEVAQDLGIGSSILYGWVRKQGQSAQLGSGGGRAPQERGEEPVADELRRLRRQLAHLQLENDILKKAAVILGTNPLPANMR
jgi:transposase